MQNDNIIININNNNNNNISNTITIIIIIIIIGITAASTAGETLFIIITVVSCPVQGAPHIGALADGHLEAAGLGYAPADTNHVHV